MSEFWLSLFYSGHSIVGILQQSFYVARIAAKNTKEQYNRNIQWRDMYVISKLTIMAIHCFMAGIASSLAQLYYSVDNLPDYHTTIAVAFFSIPAMQLRF